MALYSRAKQKLIPPGSNDPQIKARIGILHVDAGNAYDLYRYFNGPSGGIESHFHIPKEKVNGINLFQYRDTDYEADANHLANPFALSFETQGYGAGTWTAHQIREIKFAMDWCKTTHGIPYRVVDTWNDPKGGWGYHTLFGAPSPWTPVAKSCPGDERKEQFHDILVPWMREKEGGMGFTANDRGMLLEVNNKLTEIQEYLEQRRLVERHQYLRLRAHLAREFNATDAQLDAVLAALDAE